MPGQGALITSKPSSSPPAGSPSSVSTSASMPRNGLVPEPGLSGVVGLGVIMNPPVSVCHQVSMIGQRPLPITRWYQRHASGLIGSPTEPSSRSLLRSDLFGQSSPKRIRPRIAVGAVYRIVTPYFWATCHQRPGLGYEGAPS